MNYLKLCLLAVCVAGILALPAGAAAAPPNGGGYCGASANGCEAAAEAGAQCDTGAGSGAFGAFGTYGTGPHDFGINNPGLDGRPGADGQQTGLNNSAICGNRP
ncbi:MAG TPA: hypothetical protein VHQ97_07180 [Solirubrobacterales bacterium]|nr:hypothetical protein [Solirubrobacterales bacterium]